MGCPRAAFRMKLTGLDHIVLCVADVDRAVAFYERILGMQPREERPGKRSLHFGSCNAAFTGGEGRTRARTYRPGLPRRSGHRPADRPCRRNKHLHSRR